ncbi:hypothetical protein [Pseudomonas fluorescens]|uniref:hypothetical protein n=1 Tax=Pseudomonas fluorescens TaxID=294 RepID=UPI0012408B5B|nr:hypothetical protein [Pseudomonas fluorescens]
MDTIMAMGLGDRLGIFSFWCGILAVIFTFLGLISGFVGTQLTGKGISDTIKATHETARQASIRVDPQWGEFIKVVTDALPYNAIKATLKYQMTASDTRLPLQIRFSAFENGWIHTIHSGESGMAEVRLEEPRTFYVSAGHPGVDLIISVAGYEF